MGLNIIFFSLTIGSLIRKLIEEGCSHKDYSFRNIYVIWPCTERIGSTNKMATS